jgi:hypothetical protein
MGIGADEEKDGGEKSGSFVHLDMSVASCELAGDGYGNS